MTGRLVTRREAAELLGYSLHSLKSLMQRQPTRWPQPVGQLQRSGPGRPEFLYDLDELSAAVTIRPRQRTRSEREVVREEDPERMVCLVCGGSFRSLAGHLRVHGMTAAQYREAHSLARTRSLVSATTRERLSAQWHRRTPEKRPHTHGAGTPPVRQVRPGRKLTQEALQQHRAVRAPRWEAMLTAVQAWESAERRLPRPTPKAPPAERELGKWLANQRAFHKRGTLTEERANLLDRHLPGWNRPTQRDLWKTRALEVSVFVQTHDRLPTEKGKEDGEERLGAWVSRQRTAARTDPEKFAPRRRVLDQIAPGWLPETSHGPAASRTRIDRTVEEAAHADGAQSVAAWINGWHRQGLSRRATAAIMGVSPGTLARLIREHGISWTQTPAPAERTPFAEIVHRLDRNLPLPRPDAASARDRRLAEWIASRPDARTRLATISRTLDTGRP